MTFSISYFSHSTMTSVSYYKPIVANFLLYCSSAYLCRLRFSFVYDFVGHPKSPPMSPLTGFIKSHNFHKISVSPSNS